MKTLGGVERCLTWHLVKWGIRLSRSWKLRLRSSHPTPIHLNIPIIGMHSWPRKRTVTVPWRGQESFHDMPGSNRAWKLLKWRKLVLVQTSAAQCQGQEFPCRQATHCVRRCSWKSAARCMFACSQLAVCASSLLHRECGGNTLKKI